MVGASTMATSIDFQQLLREERRRAIESRKKKASPNGGENSALYEGAPAMQARESSIEIELGKYRCGSLENVYYIPDFLSRGEETALVAEVEEHGKNKKPWVQLTQRRLQNIGGVPHFNGMISEPLPAFVQKLNEKLAKSGILSQAASGTVPNHVLLNEYTQGKGIAPHKDGPLYKSIAIIVSLCGTARLDFLENATEQKTSPSPGQNRGISNRKAYKVLEKVLLMPRSCLVFTSAAYDKYFHGIKSAALDSKSGICNEHLLPTEMQNCSISGNFLPRSEKRLSITLRHAKTSIMPGKEKPGSILMTPEAQEEMKRRELRWLHNICEKHTDDYIYYE